MRKYIKLVIVLFGLFIPINTLAMTKTETVYSNLDLNGSVKKTTVSTKLSDTSKGDVVDYTKLSKIKNVNGYEKFSRDSERIVWKSTGKEIVYEGVLNDNLPISVNVKYYLNGEEVNPNKINNKSGNIKIIFNFINNDYNTNYSMYVPYVVDLSTTISNKYNSNYYVSNGKYTSINDDTAFTAIAAPGLYDSTGISELRSMDQITLSYDTTKFKKMEFYLVITPKLLSNIDIDKVNQIDSKLSSIKELQNGVNELENGAASLSDGSKEILNGLERLNGGLKSARDGSLELVNGLKQVNQGTSSLSSLNELVDKLYETYKNNNVLLNQINSGALQQELENKILAATNEKTVLENQLNGVNASISQLEYLEQQGSIDPNQQAQLEQLRNNKVLLENGILQYEQGIAEANANLQTLPVAPYKIAGANEVISQVLCGVLGVSDMNYVNDNTIAMFKSNINNLVGGVNSLYEGSTTLSNGLGELYQGSNKLLDGNKKMDSGIDTLKGGISKLNKEGINKLSSLANRVQSYTGNSKRLINLSKNYSGYGSNNVSSTVFVYKLS